MAVHRYETDRTIFWNFWCPVTRISYWMIYVEQVKFNLVNKFPIDFAVGEGRYQCVCNMYVSSFCEIRITNHHSLHSAHSATDLIHSIAARTMLTFPRGDRIAAVGEDVCKFFAVVQIFIQLKCHTTLLLSIHKHFSAN